MDMGGIGGVPGVTSTSRLIADARIAVTSIKSLILLRSDPTMRGPTSCPIAPPRGLEIDAILLAVTRDEDVNHMSVK